LRFIVWLLFMGAVGLGVWELFQLFPGRADSGMDEAYLVRLIGVLALVSSSVVFGRRIKLGEAARHASIWIAIGAVLMLGYSFQNELRDLGLRLRSELIPSYPLQTDPRALVLTASDGGQFYAIGSVNGTAVTFLIDTGASDIVLSPADADRIGIDTKALNFTRDYETANGAGRGAPYTVDKLTIGPIELSNVPVSINQAPMSESLLGMPFFRRLESFEIKDRRLYLRSRASP
jgi:aspartyl protease family protein